MLAVRINYSKINSFGILSQLFGDFMKRYVENKASCIGMDIFIILKSVLTDLDLR